MAKALYGDTQLRCGGSVEQENSGGGGFTKENNGMEEAPELIQSSLESLDFCWTFEPV